MRSSVAGRGGHDGTRVFWSVLAEKVVTIVPEQSNEWNTLGVARFRAGDAAGAAVALEKSATLKYGDNAANWLYLALVRARLGDVAKARECRDRGVALQEKQPADAQLRRLRDEVAAALGGDK